MDFLNDAFFDEYVNMSKKGPFAVEEGGYEGELNLAGVGINPLTMMPYSDQYKKLNLEDRWRDFSAYKNAEKVLSSLKNNDAIIIISGTGSGKTVIVPKLVLKYFGFAKKVGVSLPKQIVTKSSADYGALTLDVAVGNEVGYKYKGSPAGSQSTSTKLLYATHGTFVAKLLNDPYLDEFNSIIIDEAHERQMETDFLIYLLRQALVLRKARAKPLDEFKVVVMSATIDKSIFERYFRKFSFESLEFSAAPNFPIKSIYSKKPIVDYIQAAFGIIENIVYSKMPGNIIVFVSSSKETSKVCDLINADPILSSEIACIEIYSGVNAEAEELAKHESQFKEVLGKARKVVIATEVAESSITIHGIKYVIDNGKAYVSMYRPDLRANELTNKFVTKSQIKQRKGRTGRTEPGVCFHMYTESEYNALKEYPMAGIFRSDMVIDTLRILNQNGNVKSVITTYKEFLEPPTQISITDSIQRLYELDIIDIDGNITEIGSEVYKKLNTLTINQAVAIYYAGILGCVRDVCAIIAMYTGQKGKLFIQDNGKPKAPPSLNLKNDFGDLISLLIMFDSDSTMKIPNSVKTVYNELKSTFKFSSPDPGSEYYEVEKIISCFYLGYKTNLGKLNAGKNKYLIYANQLVVPTQDTLVNFKNSKLYENIFYVDYSIVNGNPSISLINTVPDFD